MDLHVPKPADNSIDDWRQWEGRWELIGGKAFDLTPTPCLEHQRISGLLAYNLAMALKEINLDGGHREVFFAPLDVFLGNDVVEPDLLVISDDAKKAEHGIMGAPDLVVEITSPLTASRDHTRKRWLYEASGVPEYLIVDPDVRVALLLRLKDGRYEEAQRAECGSVLALLGQTVSITLD